MKILQNVFVRKIMATAMIGVMLFMGAVPVESYGRETPEQEKTTAMEYLAQNYTNARIITNGGDGITLKGTTCSIGLKIPSSGSSITSFRLKTEGSSSNYISGWYVTDTSWQSGTNAWTPSNPGSRAFIRPVAEEGPKTFTATLKLFDRNTVSVDEVNAGTAEALASQDFTIVILPAPQSYQVTFKVIDKDTKADISGAMVTVKKDWSTVSPIDGKYIFEEGETVTLTVEASGYQKYSNSSYQASKTGEEIIELAPIQNSRITFNVKDNNGNAIDGAEVSVTKGYYPTIAPNDDGSYTLEDGTEYRYRVSAVNYDSKSGSFTPSGGDETIEVELAKNISQYKVEFSVKDELGAAVNDTAIKVTYEEYDYDYYEYVTYEVNPGSDGTYPLNKGTEYTYTVEKDGYKKVSGTINPSGDDDKIVKDVILKAAVAVDPADQAKVDAVKAKFDGEFGALRPDFAVDENIARMVLDKIGKYEGIDVTGITVALNSSSDTTYIEENGNIKYVNGALNTLGGTNSQNVNCTFAFALNGAEAVSASKTVTVCWNRDYFNTKIREEADALTWEKIKNANDTQDNVSSDLTLPQCMGTSVRAVWSEIEWFSSNSDAISFEDTGYGLIAAKKGVVHPQEKDTEVVLTAKFKANNTVINTNVEKVEDFEIFTKSFKVTIKGTGEAKPTEEELQEILNRYYTDDLLKDFNSGETLDINNCQSDIQLPRYTKIKDDNGDFIFKNGEITVTSSETDVISVLGYRANVDVFQNEDKTVNLVVTFTRDGVTATKTIPVKVKSITEEMLDAELALMEKVKAHYFDGINDGQYKDERSVTGNLKPFQEAAMGADGKLVWSYNIDTNTGEGIIADGYFDDPWEMESAGYNKFKSSNSAVVQNENLVVHRQEVSTEVTVTSWLSSAKYGKFAQSHPDNEKLQKLFRQPVEAKLLIKGTKNTFEGLKDAIDAAKTFSEKISEGTEPGQYPAGAKKKLKDAISEAEAVANSEEATEEELESAAIALNGVLADVKASQIAEEINITVRINKEHNKQGETRILSVSSSDAENAGFSKADSMVNTVTVLDALAAIHQKLYGEDFERNPEEYLVVNASGYITKIFEENNSNVGFLVNNRVPADEITGIGSTCASSVLKNNDILNIFLYGDVKEYSDMYLYFDNAELNTVEGEIASLKLYGFKPAWQGEVSPQKNCRVVIKDYNKNIIWEGTTNGDGITEFRIEKTGVYTAEVVEAPYDYFVAPFAVINVEKQEDAKPAVDNEDPENDADNQKQPEKIVSVKTGDEAAVYVWAAIAIVSLVVIIAVYVLSRRRKYQ